MFNTSFSQYGQKALINKSFSKQKGLKKYLVEELEKRGVDKYTKNLKEMCSEIQACMIEYQE